VGFGGFVVLVVGLVIAVAAGGSHPASPIPGGSTQAARLQAAPANLVVRGGQREPFEVRVERLKGNEALQVTLENLPPNVNCTPASLPPGQVAATLYLQADEIAVDGEREAALVLWAAGQMIDSRSVPLVVQHIPHPRLLPLAPLVLQSGEARELDCFVDRDDHDGALTLRVANLPDGLAFEASGCQPGKTSFRVKVEAQPAADEGDYPLSLQMYAGAQLLDEQKLALTVRKKSLGPTPRLFPIVPLTVNAGGVAAIRATLDRQGYNGPAEVRLDGVPDGLLDWTPGRMGNGQTVALVAVKAPRGAREGKYTFKATAVYGDRATEPQEVVLTVLSPDAVIPPVGGGKSRVVTFRTVDQVELTGTFYPSPAAMKQPCVLLLPDPRSKRSEEGLVRLAEALQKQGYAVLAFDFRGCGDSTAIKDAPAFWGQTANQKLKTYKRLAGFTDQPRTLSLDDLEPAQYPWLVNDVAAARLFLDRLNDEGEVNSASLIVVGAGEGATLGALWLATEHFRFAVQGRRVDFNAPEARHVAGAVWIGLSESLGGQKADVDGWLNASARIRAAGLTMFVCGAKDADAAGRNKAWLRLTLNPVFPNSLTLVPDADQAGQKLLARELETEKAVVRRVGELAAARAFALEMWDKRAGNAAYYLDRTRSAKPLQSQRAGTLIKPVPVEWFHTPDNGPKG
jgi:pimeloyl-ACP methyl ester carboxylesterase